MCGEASKRQAGHDGRATLENNGRCAEVRPVVGVSWPRKAMRPLNSIGSID
jgi:hypothetical protein